MNATPLDDIAHEQHGFNQKYAMMFAGIVVLAIAMGIGAFMLRQQVTTTQTTTTRAALPSCLPTDTIPLPADPECYDGEAPTTITSDNWKPCRRAGMGYCKSKGNNCVECRDDDGPRIICRCRKETPTLAQKITPICPVPNVVTNVTISCPTCVQ